MDESSGRPSADLPPLLPARRAFQPTTAGCLEALAFVRSALEPLYAPRLIARAELVVGELASNAMIHAKSTFEVRVGVSHAGLTISVSDEVPVDPRGSELTPVWPHGLFVVAAAATQWGVTADRTGKVVWAVMPSDDAALSSSPSERA